MRPPHLFPLLLPLLVAQPECARAQDASSSAAAAVPIPINLTSLFNNKAASPSPGGGGDFDGHGTSFPAAFLPKESTFQWRGFNFTLPSFQSASSDNLIADNQTLSLPSGQYALAGLLAAGDHDLIQRNVKISYSDGSSEDGSVLVDGFQGRGVINTPFTFYTTTQDNNATSISFVTLRLNPFKNVTSLAFGGGSSGRLHIFAMSLFTSTSIWSNSTTPFSPPQEKALHPRAQPIGKAAPLNATGPIPVVQYVRSTTKLNDTDLSLHSNSSRRIQLIEVVVHNLPSSSNPNDTSSAGTLNWITTPYSISIDSPGVETVFPATIHRLRAGLSARFFVGVSLSSSVKQRGSPSTAVAVISTGGAEVTRSASFSITAGIPEYKDSDLESLLAHESAMWFDGAKLGIFVHWGVYAVPAFSPVGVQYAEWYWWDQHFPLNVSSPTWEYHKATYGENVVYDDFIQNFTASKFTGEGLVDLFHNSGAKYFVQVSKHHDGVAIFDTKNTSDRNTVKLGPKRDLLSEIMSAASAKYPTMRRGTYFSLPEWYHPDYAQFGIGDTTGSVHGFEADGTPIIGSAAWPGGLAHNAYNESAPLEPYTGYVKSPTNYLVDIQGPQMKMLMDNYGTEILWCDIGGANFTSELIGTWFNQAYDQGRSVILNDRCGVISYDYSTPEYRTFPNVREDKWESNAGLDPFSYGFNAQTPPERYANASKTIVSLVDIVSKNGNFLVDIGPREDGTVAQEEIDTLIGVGNWLNYSAPGIFGTKYWNYASQEGNNIRFTTTDEAFYIFSLVYPNTTTGIVLNSPVPIMERDQMFMLGASTGKPVNWTRDASGTTTIRPTIAEINRANYAWGFVVRY